MEWNESKNRAVEIAIYRTNKQGLKAVESSL